MTIVQPNKDTDLKRAIWFSSLIVGVAIVMTLVSYVSMIGLRHDLASMRDGVDELKIANAEIKNAYYQLLSTDNLERVAAERGLVKDKNPGWVLASQR